MSFVIAMENNLFKKQRELFLFDRFKSVFEESHLIQFSQVIQDERPDFDFWLNDKHIGIELTEIYQDDINSTNGSKLKEHETACIKFTNAVIQKIQANSNIKFIIDIKFGLHRKIGKDFITEYAGIIANICLQVLSLLENKQRIEIPNTGGLPYQIYSIFLTRYDQLDTPVNATVSGGKLERLSSAVIQNAIRKKENKLSEFRQMDEQWLLIIKGNGYAGSFSEMVANIPLTTNFTRVFLFSCFEQEVTILV